MCGRDLRILMAILALPSLPWTFPYPAHVPGPNLVPWSHQPPSTDSPGDGGWGCPQLLSFLAPWCSLTTPGLPAALWRGMRWMQFFYPPYNVKIRTMMHSLKLVDDLFKTNLTLRLVNSWSLLPQDADTFTYLRRDSRNLHTAILWD